MSKQPNYDDQLKAIAGKLLSIAGAIDCVRSIGADEDEELTASYVAVQLMPFAVSGIVKELWTAYNQLDSLSKEMTRHP